MATAKKPKKITTAAKIRQYMKDFPEASPKEIAKALSVSLDYIYVVRNVDKTRAAKTSKKVAPMNTITLPINSVNTVRFDPVNHPAHYKAGGIETIDFIEAKRLNYNLGNVVKYITRSDLKGNRKQDLEKAMWYLKRELEHGVRA